MHNPMKPNDFLAYDMTCEATAVSLAARIAFGVRGERGSKVLLVMGLGVPGRAWVHQVPALSEHHRVAFFDHRGCGASRAAPGRYTMTLLAGDALAVMDHLGWERVHLVGVSLGGMVAQNLAITHPDRLRSLTLIATHPGGPRGRRPPLRGLAAFLRAQVGPRRGRVEALRQLLFPPEFLSNCDQNWLNGVIRADFGDPVPLAYRLSQIHAVHTHDTRRDLHRLAGLPTLIIKPGRDLLVAPAQSDVLHRLIPGSRLVTLRDAGHGVVRQCHAQVNAALLEHMERAE